ncbi:MAG TPA: 1-acyl-sn-glycerol-3-phosphate acyltransferase, partial [Kofleriaceae bacterium]|nr:1-acyl-sn-glycerol-3-phosphate acyltransferase [Kofleriaceae bacterium]
TVDGLRAFHCRRMGLRLVPAWPLDTARLSPSMATLAEGLPPFGDPRALLACAWGRPSEAFGEMYRRFDGPRRVARLPGPPYHFMSRVARVDGPMGGMQVGSSVEAQYDVPRDAWYFADSCAAAMPFCVLLEIALQPCGWLASYVGCALAGEADLVFRNLEGSGAVAGALGPGAGTLTTRAILRSCSSAGGAILVAFDVAVRAAGVEVMTLDTVFGFFGADSMKQQVGLPASDEARAAIDAPGNADIDLTARSGPLFEGTLRIPSGRLLMLDRVSHVAPHGGRAGLGQIRAYKDVAAGDWYFKAHFFQDPVQPGSLGLDAMLQALQILMIERGLGDGIDQPQFEPIASGAPVSWKYRGQVLPENARVTVEVDILRVARDARGHLAEARGSLWVDGKRIYEATLATRIVSGGFDREATRRFWRDATGMAGAWAGEDVLFALLDRFVRRVHVEAPLARRARPGAVFLANHQVTVETVLAALVIGGMTEAVPVLVAKAEHRDSWVGALTQLFAERPGFRDPGLMQFVDRGDPSAVLALRRALADELRAGRSVLVHVEGTRATRGRQPVSVMSSVFLDLALEVDADVVPVRFTGGLPLDGAERREFPVGYGAQDYWFGRPIAAAELRAWRFDERNERVLRAINETGGSIALEVPSPAALAFEARVAALRAAGVPEPQAVVRCALDDLVDPSAEGLTLASDGVLPQEPAAAWLGALARWLRGEL